MRLDCFEVFLVYPARITREVFGIIVVANLVDGKPVVMNKDGLITTCADVMCIRKP